MTTPRNQSALAGRGASGAPSNGRPRKSSKKAKNGQSEGTSRFYGIPMPGVKPEELSGSLIVVEGTDGSGRSTQISCSRNGLRAKASRWKTMGLRRSFLVGEDIDGLLADNAVTRHDARADVRHGLFRPA